MPPVKKNETPLSLRGQKCLTSFFGAAKSSKTGKELPEKKVQTGIRSAFEKTTQAEDVAAANSGKDVANGEGRRKDEQEHEKVSGQSDLQLHATSEKTLATSENEQKAEKVEKEEKITNLGNEERDDLMDTDDEENEAVRNSSTKTNKAAMKRLATKTGSASRKRIIDSDDEIENEDDGSEEGHQQADRSSSTLEEKDSPKRKRSKRMNIVASKSSKMEMEDEEEGSEDDEVDDAMDSEEEEYKDDGTASVDEDEMGDVDVDEEEERDKLESDEDEEEAEKIPLRKLKTKLSSSKELKQGGKKSNIENSNSFFAPNSRRKKNTPDDPQDKSSKTSNPSSSKQAKSLPVKSTPTSSSVGTKSEAAAKGMKSDSALRAMMDADTDTWSNSIPANKPKPNIKNGNGKNGADNTPGTTPYSALCDTFSAIEVTSGRLEIQEKLTELFRMVLLREGGGENIDSNDNHGNNNNNNGINSRSDLYDLLYLASNSVAPSYECVELGVGDSVLQKAIGEASGTNPNMIKKKYEAEGDLGTVAQTCKGKQRTLVGFGKVGGMKPLMVKEVLNVFRQIAMTSGSQSQKWKVDKIKGLLVRAKGAEAKYIIRGLQGKLRIGLAQTTVLASLAHAVVLTRPKRVDPLTEDRLKEIRKLDGTDDEYPDYARKMCEKNLSLETKLETAVNIVKKAYSEVPSFDALLDALLSVPLQELHKACTLTPGIPVVPMLAKPTKSVLEVLKRLNGLRFTCEYKYDGERAQVHMTPDGVTKVFSRNLLNTSEKFPEVPLYVQESCKSSSVTSFVLDTEVVAYNRETKQFVPFQVLSTRKRTEESAETAKVQVVVQAFDLMYLNGKSLLDKPLAERRELLLKNFTPVDGKFQFATGLDHTENGDTTVIEEFLDNAVKGQCEGLMVKTLDVNAAYEPSRRSLNWLKLKKDYLEGLGDSVDLVPLGAYHGRGKRTGVYGAYLLACYDEDTEEFQSVCKIGTGFSEEDLKELSTSLKQHIIPEKSSQYNVSDALECDVWFDAIQVWEVKAADLSKSSTHKGAIDKTGESGRGIGLRFPRFERVRTDKKPEEATTSDQILDMYYAQDSIVGGDGGGDDDGI
mmetsp:Transcript_5766/g.11827  ORF Transcript_5766/g.11827 Transcript_5766/m.11827 type:complete len:1094 (+) Transcript_5766:357-3638(+)